MRLTKLKKFKLNLPPLLNKAGEFRGQYTHYQTPFSEFPEQFINR